MTELIPGPAGQLELELSLPSPKVQAKPITAIFCHPHPLHAGTMNNKVITTLVRTCTEIGITAIRFNFRGVGQSEGHYGEGIKEQEDLKAVTEWARTQYPDHTVWSGGFSFGGYVALASVQQINPALVIVVAPAVHHFDTRQIPSFDTPWILLQGEQDTTVPPDTVYDFARTRFAHNHPTVIQFPDADHFFHGQITLLRDLLQPKLLAKLEK